MNIKLGTGKDWNITIKDRPYPCNKCGKFCTTHLARLCDECFEVGSKIEPPRQTGRTFKLIQEMWDVKFLILVVHNEFSKQHWERVYPWLRGRIHSAREKTFWMRSMNGTHILVDHCVTEFYDRYTDEFMRCWYAITPPERK